MIIITSVLLLKNLINQQQLFFAATLQHTNLPTKTNVVCFVEKILMIK